MRSATLIDFIYAAILYYLKVVSTIPISTTWVFIGLLGGRELAIQLRIKLDGSRLKGAKHALRLIWKDVLYALIGLLVSILLAVSINEHMQQAFIDFFNKQ